MNESLEQPPAKTDKQLAAEYLEYLKSECESVGESTDTTDCENPHLALALRYHHAHAKQRDELQRQLADVSRAMQIPWKHRDGPVNGVDGCACIACELHRVYQSMLAVEREAREKAEAKLALSTDALRYLFYYRLPTGEKVEDILIRDEEPLWATIYAQLTAGKDVNHDT